jgi:hypothetical protein
MLKRNLIAIVIVTLGLVMTINTFGQGRTPVSKKDKPKRSDLIKPIHAEVNEVMIDGMKVYGNQVTLSGGRFGNSETSRTSKSNKQDKLGNFEIQGIKSPRDVTTGQATGKTQKSTSRIQPPQPKGMNKADLTEQLSIQSPRDVASGQATGKRQHKPVKNRNLGDTGTHEVGH